VNGTAPTKLGDVVEFCYGRALPKGQRVSGSIPVYGSNGVTGWHDEFLVSSPTVIVGRKGSAGAVHLTDSPCYPIDTTYYVRPRCSNALENKYIFYLLQRLKLGRLATATGVPGLNREDAYALDVVIPQLDEQRRIVDILDRAASIRRLRQQAQNTARLIIPALFNKMFGDPIRNPMGWSVQPLGEIADVASGVTKGRRLGEAATVEVPYLRVANVQDGHLNLTEVKQIPLRHSEMDRFRLLPGDLLMTEGGDPDKLGRGALWAGELPYCAHQNHVFRVRADGRNVLPHYLTTLASPYGKAYFLRVAKRTTGIASINKTQLSAFPVLLPPLNLQREFEQRVQLLDCVIKRQFAAEAVSTAAISAVQSRMFG